uniref:C1q domain-containing protein n=1 Tax=Lepeophtheirus salmonis TaxID=72036 RepID=A0A0K2SZP3_LEPSM
MFIFWDPIGLLLCLNILLTRPIHSTSSKSQLLNPLKLDLRQFRNSRQFSTMQSDGNDPADVSLIDALQKWADALETQISLTHGEVLTLRSESRTAQEEISQLKSENIRRDTELARLRMETEEIKETGKEFAQRLNVLTSSMTNYMNRISSQTERLYFNSSELRDRLNYTITNVDILTSNTDYVKKKLITQGVDIRALLNRLDRQESSVQKLNRSSLSLDSFSTTIVNLTNTVYNDIASIKDSTVTNFTTLAVEMNALKLGFRSTLLNTTNSLDKRISALKVEINELNITSGRLQRYKMETDTKFLRLEGKYGNLKDWATDYELQISNHVQARNNFSNNVLSALNDFGSHLSESREDIRNVLPKLSRLNTTLLNSLGDLESQIVDVETKADLKLQTVRQEVFRNAGNIEKINISLAHNSQELSHQLSTLNFVQGSLGADLRSATETVMSKSNDLQTNFKNLMDDNDKIRLDLSSIRNNSMSLMMSFDDLTINVSRISDSTESLEDMLEDVVENSVPSLRKELDSLQVRVRSTESDTESTLYSLKSNLKEVAGSIPHLHSSLGNVTSGLDIRVTEIENRIRGFSIKTHESYGERIQVVEGNVTLTTDRLKRVIEFAENIKSELDLLEISLETSQKDFINKQNSLGNNFSVFSIDVSTLRKSTIELQSKVESLNYVDKNFREEFSKLSNEILSMKNTNYDVEGGIKTLKKSASTVTTTLEAIDESIKRHELVQGNQDKSISDLRTDISSLRAALTSLTNTIFILKARFSNESPTKHHSSSGSIQSLDEVYRSSGSTNLTTLTREVLFVKNELSSVIRRDMKEVKSDVVNLKSILNSMVKQFGSVMDPSRFSCSVTSDEIRTAGVITYSVCNVNSDEMMNKNNGHVTVKQSGDYLLSFTANLVSVNSKAIWCALYKQSPGSDGWKVLGMINNFQSDAAAEDDRDSASLTLISNLEAGDQIWVEWRGYGESFLYSNPYRLISFTGLLVKKDSS